MHSQTWRTNRLSKGKVFAGLLDSSLVPGIRLLELLHCGGGPFLFMQNTGMLDCYRRCTGWIFPTGASSSQLELRNRMFPDTQLLIRSWLIISLPHHHPYSRLRKGQFVPKRIPSNHHCISGSDNMQSHNIQFLSSVSDNKTPVGNIQTVHCQGLRNVLASCVQRKDPHPGLT